MIRLFDQWSGTKLDRADCMRRMFLIYLDRVPQEFTVSLAAGSYVHRGGQKFYDDPRHFRSAETYAASRVATWKRIIAPTKMYGKNPITEQFDGEIWAAAETIIRPCSHHFYEMFHDHIFQHGEKRPIAVEKSFHMRVGPYVFVGAFDLIDGFGYKDFKTDNKTVKLSEGEKSKLEKIVSRFSRLEAVKEALSEEEQDLLKKAHNTALSYRPWEPHPVDLAHRYQFTIYAAALSALAASDPTLAHQMGLSRSQRQQLFEHPLSLMGEVKGEYVRLQTGVSYEVHRTTRDLVELLNIVESAASRLKQQDFSLSRGRHCAFCHVKRRCDHDLQEGRFVPILNEQQSRPYRVLEQEHQQLLLFAPSSHHQFIEVPRDVRIFFPTPHRKKRKLTTPNLFDGVA